MCLPRFQSAFGFQASFAGHLAQAEVGDAAEGFGAGASCERPRRRAPVVQLDVVLQRESVAPVDVQADARRARRDLRSEREGHGGELAAAGRLVSRRTRGLLYEQPRASDSRRAVRERVRDRLERADRDTELFSARGVGDAEVEGALREADECRGGKEMPRSSGLVEAGPRGSAAREDGARRTKRRFGGPDSERRGAQVRRVGERRGR